jgi:hypothetical protein
MLGEEQFEVRTYCNDIFTGDTSLIGKADTSAKHRNFYGDLKLWYPQAIIS